MLRTGYSQSIAVLAVSGMSFFSIAYPSKAKAEINLLEYSPENRIIGSLSIGAKCL